VQEISAASSEQDRGVEQINRAIAQLDQVIQQNASASEEMAATSEELTRQADQLQEGISFFRIGDEAHQTHGVRLAQHSFTVPSEPAPAEAEETSKSGNGNGNGNGNGHGASDPRELQPVTADSVRDELDSEFKEY
jgi:methyl-accepting chemotaxis protein